MPRFSFFKAYSASWEKIQQHDSTAACLLTWNEAKSWKLFEYNFLYLNFHFGLQLSDSVMTNLILYAVPVYLASFFQQLVSDMASFLEIIHKSFKKIIVIL